MHAGNGKGLGDLFLLGRGDQLKANVLDPSGDIGERHRRLVPLQLHGLGSEVDGSIRHPRHAADDLFDAGRTGGTVHALNYDIFKFFLIRHVRRSLIRLTRCHIERQREISSLQFLSFRPSQLSFRAQRGISSIPIGPRPRSLPLLSFRPPTAVISKRSEKSPPPR